MNTLAALAAATLLAASAPAPSLPGAGGGDATAEATSVTYDTGTGEVVLEGAVVVRRGVVTLRARSARYDPATGEVHASGGVLLVDASRVLAADGVRLVLGGPFEAEGVVAFLKDGAAPVGDPVTLDEARGAGANRATISGARLSGEPSGRIRLVDARLTLCDCAGGAPSWELRARKADVIAGERVILTWPVLYVTPRFLLVDRPVPVLAVPWLYVPLSDRQTGLLVPQVESTGATGLTLAQPLFVTLGPSADLTFTPRHAFGRARADVAAGRPSVRGPGAQLEARWAPAIGAAGELRLDWFHDLDDEPGGARGDRLALSGRHAQRSGPGRLDLELALASDPVWYRDFTSDLLLRSAFYARSAALGSYAWEQALVEVGAAYHEPLAPGGRVPGLEYGTFGGEVPVFHRLPAASLAWLPPALGPLRASGRVGVARFAPLSGITSDGGIDGLGPGDRGYAGGPDGFGEGDGSWIGRERLAATRADARLELSVPVPLAGGAVRLEPYLRGAAVGYAYDAAVDDALARWAVYGASAELQLSRRFGAVLHDLVPRVEVRGGTRRFGADAPVPAYDVWDRVPDQRPLLVAPAPGEPLVALAPWRRLSAAPEGAFTQLRVALENRLAAPGLTLQLGLGQDADLRAGRLAESWVRAVATSGPVALDLSTRFLALDSWRDEREAEVGAPRYRSWLDALTEARATLEARDRRGDRVHASILAYGQGGSGLLAAGVDPLFDLRPLASEATAQGAAGARVVIGAATLGYDALLPLRPVDVADGADVRHLSGWTVQQHTVSFEWSSPCRCFAARALVRLDDRGEVTGYSATLDLSRLASAGLR